MGIALVSVLFSTAIVMIVLLFDSRSAQEYGKAYAVVGLVSLFSGVAVIFAMVWYIDRPVYTIECCTPAPDKTPLLQYR